MTETTDLGLTWTDDTVRGKAVRVAEPTPVFWDLWREHKDLLREEGFRVAKPGDDFIVVDENDQNPATTNAIAESSQATSAPEGYDIPVPEGLAYLPYQCGGVKALQDRPSALLADPPGLGKTIMIAGLLNKAPDELRTVLIVVPASLKINWHKELTRWLVIPRRIDVINGGKESFPSDPDIIVINYDVLAKHSDNLLSLEWDCVVFDESHYLKNPKSARTIHSLKIRARRRYALTGTPIPNRPIEIQPILSYLAPDDFGGKGSWYKFADRYCAGYQSRWGYDATGASNLGELRRRLRSTIMIRREKAEVLTDLPAKRRQIIVLPADNYKKALQTERSADRVDEALSDALKLIESGGSIDFAEISKVRHQTALEKVPAVLEHLEGITEPVVVFAHHHDVIAGLAEGLEAQGRSIVLLHGKMTAEQKQQSVDAFQNGDADVFIGGMKAAGLGITLTRASICVFAELDWSPNTISQCEDRLHRIGQHSPVHCIHLVIDQSIDHRIIELVVSKQSVISEVVQKQSERELVKIAEPITLEALAAELISGGRFKVRDRSHDSDNFIDLLNAVIKANIHLQAEGLTIHAASPKSSNPGSLYVKNSDDEYQGKIAPDGRFRAISDAHDSTASRLAQINASPEAYLETNAERIDAALTAQENSKPHSFDDFRGTVTDLDLTNLINGRYAVPGADTRLKISISRGCEGGKWAGAIFVEDAAIYGQRQRYGMQRPGAAYHGAIADSLRAILADPFEASKAYGRLTNSCGVCGAALENEKSVANGIGPICAGKFGL